jgi:hypothetical protein
VNAAPVDPILLAVVEGTLASIEAELATRRAETEQAEADRARAVMKKEIEEATLARACAEEEEQEARIAKARAEGKLAFYTSLSQDDANFIVARFEAANPGIKVTINRKSSEPLVAQLITEIKAGRVLADVLESGGLDLAKPIKEGYIAEFRPPAAAAFPANLRDPKGLWTAARLGIEDQSWLIRTLDFLNAAGETVMAVRFVDVKMNEDLPEGALAPPKAR